MNLAQLLEPFEDILPLSPLSEDVLHTDVVGVTSDSRKAVAGWVFVALVGSRTDGHQYVRKALDAGALAVVIQPERQAQAQCLGECHENDSVLTCANTYEALGALSSRFHGDPGRAMKLVGVTGTNGKTTVTHLIERMVTDWEKPVALLGTLGVRTTAKPSGQDYQTTGHTTPMAEELHRILAQMRDDGTQYVVMEVSSHALEQYRVYGCDFDVAVHTNLTQDHLDYHLTMTRYCEAKCKLFQALAPGAAAVINLDDEWAPQFLEATPAHARLLTYAIDDPQAEVRAENTQFGIGGASFTAVTPEGTMPVALKIAGRFGVYNALAALAAGLALGIPLAQCVKSLQEVSGVRGRFEVVAANPHVIVDYAHTPDGLENILQSARQVTPAGARLIVVFGCGGDRDATKRPKMGRIAEKLADTMVITSDNPRTEDPQQILTDIISGIRRFDSSRMLVISDRRQAIAQAIDLAKPDDIVVVAGKGHEDYQILADRTIHFDDREEVQAYIASRGEKPSVGNSSV